MGGSNGGLMVGNRITLFPELFGAAVSAAVDGGTRLEPLQVAW